MLILKLILENFATICLSIGLGILIITNRNFNRRTNKSFTFFILIVLGLVVVGIVDQLCSLRSSPSAMNYIASSFGYVLRPASIALLINILLRRRKINFMLWVPIMLTAIISFTSPFSHLMYWYNEENLFMRGSLAYLSHIISGIYILVFLLLAFKKHKYITVGETFTVVFSSLICIIAAILETIFSGYRFLITGAMTVSCALYYVVLFAETFKIDSLTGLLNRRTLYLDIEKLRTKNFTVISADMNGLKEINDSKGHNAGDQALKQVASIMINHSGKDFCPYRVGGDEFVILGHTLDDKAICKLINGIKYDLGKQNLMASFGYSFFTSGDNFDDIYYKADVKMYADKQQYSHR